MGGLDVLCVRSFSMTFEEKAQGVGIVTFQGEYDLSNVEEASAELKRLDRVRIAVVDLAKAEYMDSSMLGALVDFYKRARVRNQQIAFVRPGDSLGRVLTIVGLDKILPLYDSLPEALKAAGAATK